MADTAIVILLGQSLNTWRGTTRELETGWSGARQLVGGGTVQEMDFFGANAQNPFDWNETTSVVTQSETTGGQSPIAGIASQLDGLGYTRVYLGSVALGASDILTLRTRGATFNMYGMVKRLVELASGQGDTDPDIFFYMQHGESDSAAGLGSVYQADTTAYLQRCQLAAAQALGDPTYKARIILAFQYSCQSPTAGTDASDSIEVIEATRAIADDGDIDNVILYGSIYHTPISSTDLTHNTDPGQVIRGEAIGKVIADYIGGTTYAPCRIKSATLAGDTVTVQFTHNIVKDTTTVGDIGSLRNGNDGFEYFDNGSEITVDTVAISGDTATLTLASTPAGTGAQQVLRFGLQATPSSGAWPTNGPGAPIRKDQTARTSDYDITYDHYDWAMQQEITGLPYTYTPPGASSSAADALIGGATRSVTRTLTRGVTEGWDWGA